MRLMNKSNKLNRLLLIPLLMSLSGCVHGSTGLVPIDGFCKVAQPISYDSKRDTPETVQQVEAHNLKWLRLCEKEENNATQVR